MNRPLTSETDINVMADNNSQRVKYLIWLPVLYQIILDWCKGKAHYGTLVFHVSRPTGLLPEPKKKASTFPCALPQAATHPQSDACITTKQTSQVHRLRPISAWKLRKREKHSRRVSRKWLTGATFPVSKEETSYVAQNTLSESMSTYEELRKLATQKT